VLVVPVVAKHRLPVSRLPEYPPEIQATRVQCHSAGSCNCWANHRMTVKCEALHTPLSDQTLHSQGIHSAYEMPDMDQLAHYSSRPHSVAEV